MMLLSPVHRINEVYRCGCEKSYVIKLTAVTNGAMDSKSDCVTIPFPTFLQILPKYDHYSALEPKLLNIYKHFKENDNNNHLTALCPGHLLDLLCRGRQKRKMH